MRARTGTTGRVVAATLGVGLAAVLAAAPATAAAVLEPVPTADPGPVVPGPVLPGPVLPGPVLPGPIVPRPPERPLAWEVELRDSWRSPSWKQGAGRTSVAVHLDCGNVIGGRLPQYYVQLVAEGGPSLPPVMPRPVPCGTTHTHVTEQAAGSFHLLLIKATADGSVLRGKAAVSAPPRVTPA
ncbi:hypothetical protein [Cellulomonas phragmiteti]|nr:hypothetical protein [Cellulomonas phragmiteti]